MRWIAKAAVQGTLSLLPGSYQLNSVLQKHVSGSLKLRPEKTMAKLRQASRHLQNFRRSSKAERPEKVLELGTGWDPIVPIGLSLCGVDKIVSVDRVSLLEEPRLRELLDHVWGLLKEKEASGSLPSLRRGERTDALRMHAEEDYPLEDVLRVLGLEIIVKDAKSMDPGLGADLVISNNTLEHIPDGDIVAIIRGLTRAGSDSVIHSHYIDMSDHYANFDSSISPLNFYKFPRDTWRLFNNDLQYQNRLRHSDYIRHFRAAGLEVLDEDRNLVKQEMLSEVKVHTEFEEYSERDLRTIGSWITARSTGRANSNF